MFDSSGFEGTSAGARRPAAPSASSPAAQPAGPVPDVTPGPDLAKSLAALDLTDLGEGDLLDVLVGWEQVIAWATARQHEVVQASLARARGSMAREGVIAEVGATLAISPRAAQTRVGTAEALAAFPRLHHALRDGHLDPRRVETVLSHTDHLPAERAAAVIDRVLPGAGDLTLPQLRRSVRAAELAQDPAACEKAQQRAAADRSVRMTPAPDGMARIQAYLPAVGAMSVMTALTALATTQPSDDPRPMDARRADALVDLARDVLDRGVDLHGEPLPARHRRHPHVTLTATVAMAAGSTDTPAWLGGYGLITADLARQVMTDAPRHLVLSDTTGRLIARTAHAYRPGPVLTDLVTHRDRTCTFPGCGIPAAATDLDHIEPYPNRSGSPPGTLPPTRPDNLHALCRHHHRLKTHGGWTPSRDDTTGTTLWTSPLRTYSRHPEPGLLDPPEDAEHATRLPPDDEAPPDGDPPPF